ncbi:MAG: sodium-dependent transporter [Lachnospiraceae bacterium]|jgi:NSS family neurotransmitter:Na+ symporter|nr:sodium-dependent transporter [Lachnospiraceae bacterium]MCI9101019.1 sodium-dependent transporter [Lachnospiraceae bacterium]MCI9358816.1 sodium-dependent transporter [Lachnospiraceae bacterium]
MQEREKFGSRLGFILVSAGCAVGLGNVWKFPYMCGRYGGAAFILIYLVFLAILGFPIMVCEFSVGRGSQKSCAASFKKLEPEGSRWHHFSYFAIAGNYLLMMFYTMVAGWMLYYCFCSLKGDFTGSAMTTEDVAAKFQEMTGSAGTLTLWMILVVVISFGICSLGVQKGVEKITKVMMACLFVLILVLAVHSVMLPNAGEGIRFYLVPDFKAMVDEGIGNVVFGAMSQSFFTLSVGIGSMAIFGSYLDKSRSLTGETLSISCLDTFVALMAGLIIIPACFSYGIQPDAGPSLIFITLPNIFNQMAGGRIWGTFFFLFLSFAALSTVVAVFENIISFAIDLWGWERKKAVLFNIAALIVLSMPCVLGFNVLSGIQPLGPGTGIMDLEDFLVSNNLLPLGSLVYLMFCTTRYGWGWKNFIEEANAGQGMKFPVMIKGYMTFILPFIVVAIYLKGYWDMFYKQGLKYLIPWLIVAVAFLALICWFGFGGRRKEGHK